MEYYIRQIYTYGRTPGKLLLAYRRRRYIEDQYRNQNVCNLGIHSAAATDLLRKFPQQKPRARSQPIPWNQQDSRRSSISQPTSLQSNTISSSHFLLWTPALFPVSFQYAQAAGRHISASFWHTTRFLNLRRNWVSPA